MYKIHYDCLPSEEKHEQKKKKKLKRERTKEKKKTGKKYDKVFRGTERKNKFNGLYYKKKRARF